MNVHTTLIPELNFNFPIPPPSVFSSTSSSPASNGNGPLPSIDGQASSNAGRTPSPPISSAASIADMLAGKRDRDANTNTANARLNMNPALNGLTPEQIANLREQFFNANSGLGLPPASNEYENPANVVSGKINRNGAALDPLQNSFFDSNPFISLRQDSLQDYRAQLYAKLANNVAGIHQAQQQQPAQGNKSSNGVAMNGLRPAFFANAPISSNTTTNEADHQEVVKIANIAQKTLFDKLSTAFWDAFAGNNTLPAKSMVPPSSSSATTGAKRRGSNAGHGDVDGQKVADIIAGRSRLQVVKKNDDADLENLTHGIGNMGLKK